MPAPQLVDIRHNPFWIAQKDNLSLPGQELDELILVCIDKEYDVKFADSTAELVPRQTHVTFRCIAAPDTKARIAFELLLTLPKGNELRGLAETMLDALEKHNKKVDKANKKGGDLFNQTPHQPAQ
jgi:hypothetical protein